MKSLMMTVQHFNAYYPLYELRVTSPLITSTYVTSYFTFWIYETSTWKWKSVNHFGFGLTTHKHSRNYGDFPALPIEKNLMCPFVHYLRHELAPPGIEPPTFRTSDRSIWNWIVGFTFFKTIFAYCELHKHEKLKSYLTLLCFPFCFP
jgi:hypothetical protein